ncbi:hypothetical protein LINPERHAP1_LOCUS6410, partial [Linum perenne]
MPFAYRTVAVGRKLLEPMGEVVCMGYFDAHKPEGCYVKGRVRMDLFNPFLGTAPVKGEDGSSFQVFFQYEGVPCICYLCGYLGHVMGDCSHSDLVFDPLIRDSWICGVTDPDEALASEVGNGTRADPGSRPSGSKQPAGAAGKSAVRDASGPRPSAAGSPSLGPGPSGVGQGAVPSPSCCLEPPIGPLQLHTPRLAPLVDAPPSGAIKRKLEA